MANFRNPVQWLLDYFGSSKSIKITEKTALQVASFWYGVNRISGNLGSLGLNLMQELPGGGSEKVKADPRWWLMRHEPNVYQDPIVFQQAETKRALMWGNSRSVIVGNGRTTELLPQDPKRTVTGFLQGEKWHAFMPEMDDRVVLFDDVLEQMEKNPNKVVLKPDSEVLHVQGFGDGITGLSLIEYATNVLQVQLSGDKNAARTNEKGFNGKIYLQAPEGSAYFNDQKKAEEFLENWNKKHGRDGDADEVALLRNGLTVSTHAMSNRDAEAVAQQVFQRQNTALFLLLESILGDQDSDSYASVEQKTLNYLVNCLGPWLKRWEQQANRKLLTRAERQRGMYFVFNERALLRMDSKTSAEVFSLYLQNRVMNPNEVRIKLDEKPYKGGDNYENPNITPGQATESNGQPSQSNIERLQRMMNIEEKQVNLFLKENHSFEQIDLWYEKWLGKLAAAVESMGGDYALAQAHCVKSLNHIKKGNGFSLTGSAEELAEQIENG